jgi:hypothetical protein
MMSDLIPSYFHTNISLFVLLLAVIIAGGLAYYQYRRTVPPISRHMQIILGTLRGTAVAGIIILLFAPEITAVWQISHKGKLGILVDRSASMGLNEGNGSRLSNALAAAEKIENATEDQIDAVVYAFDTDTLRLKNFELDTTNLGTNIEKAIESLLNVNEDINDLIIISDGNYTVGNNPIFANIPNKTRIFTVGVGDTVDIPDLLIQDVKANQIIYQNQPTQLKVYIMARGIGEQKVLVKLFHENKLLQAREVYIGAQGETTVANFDITPRHTGLLQYRVEVPSLENELVVKNNRFSVSLDVLKGKIKIGFLSSRPSYDTKFLQLILDNINEFDVKTSIIKNRNEYFGFRPERIMDSLDVLIIHDYGISATKNVGFENAIKQTAKSRISSMLILSEVLTPSSSKLVQNLFPIQSMTKGSTGREIQPLPSVQERAIPLLSIFDNNSTSKKFWATLPPIEYNFLNIQFDPSVKILLESPNTAKKNDATQPVIAVYDGADRKSILLLGSGFWRWQFLLSEEQNFNDSWQKIINNIIRWLASKSVNKNVILSSPRNTYEVGATVILNTEVYDGSFNPVSDAQVRTKISNPMSNFEIDSKSIQEGKYESRFTPMTAGRHVIESEAWKNDVLLGKDKIEIIAKPVMQEFRDIKQNLLLLNQLAARTGGDFVQINNVADLIGKLDYKAIIRSKEKTIEVWHRWPALVAIIMLLSAEWFIRKRKGLA